MIAHDYLHHINHIKQIPTETAICIFSLTFILIRKLLEQDISFCYCGLNSQHNSGGTSMTVIEQQPPWAFRHISPHNKEWSYADPSNQKHDSPMISLAYQHSQQGSNGSSEVPSAIDADIHPPSISWRKEFIHCSENSSEFTSNTE